MRKTSLVLAGLALLLSGAAALADGEMQAPDPNGKWEDCALKFSLLRTTQLAISEPHAAALKIPLPSPSGGFAVKAEGGTVQVDINGDGTLDTKAKEGNPVFLQVKYDDGSSMNYAVRFTRTPRNEWFYETATSMAGKVGGENFSLVDADCNGKFDDVGKDAVLVGRCKWAIPLGRVVSLKGKLYHLKVDPKGETVSIQEYTGETGTLDLRKKFRAPSSLEYAVVQCGETYFNLTGKGGESVPAGKYVFLRGHLEKGKKSCDIVRGEMGEIEVGSSATMELDWGAPVRIAFKASLSKDGVHIDATLRFFGKGGEEYINFDNVIMTPDIQVKSKEGIVACKGKFATG